ncbi:MAG: glycosyltransferase family 2 protein [Erysipelotrichaceae bacterium]|nr:glycosyltransferase family 2 protein [Erysipelotrichaceae bacterium]
MKIAVLLSSYNGEKYLGEQLDSLINQSLRPSQIIIRDDGSTDGTFAILDKYCQEYDFISYEKGENLRPARSFMELIRKAPDADYYALCDQDDVWFRDKLKRAVLMLQKEDENQALLYCGRFILTDEKLNPLESEVSSLYSYTDFAHSLLYTTAPGCTMVFNARARDYIIRYDMNKEYVIIHDSIIHKVVAMFGKVILDEEPMMYYRQHGSNEIGLDGNIIKANIKRISRFLGGKSRKIRSKTAQSLINVYGSDCPKDKLDLLECVAFYEIDSNYQRRLLKDKCFKVAGINYVLFKVLVLLRYI